ncbi:MAG: hypothetical protein NZM04_08920 [Methylacidiphilales bacterium]|nr:hypothetical protein [Candidatus Methylacidiphilales bacterium]
MEPDYTDNLGAMSHIKVVPNAYLVPPYSNEKIITQMHMIDPVYAMGFPPGVGNGLYPQTIPPNVDSSHTYLASMSNINERPLDMEYYRSMSPLGLAIANLLSIDYLGRNLDNRTVPSNIGSIQYFYGNHGDLGHFNGNHLAATYDVYNAINQNSGGLFIGGSRMTQNGIRNFSK